VLVLILLITTEEHMFTVLGQSFGPEDPIWLPSLGQHLSPLTKRNLSVSQCNSASIIQKSISTNPHQQFTALELRRWFPSLHAVKKSEFTAGDAVVVFWNRPLFPLLPLF
jgi:hypothetical protein